MVWLVISGPLIVVVAAVATAVVAIRGADPVVSAGGAESERPAVQARNQGAAAPSASRP